MSISDPKNLELLKKIVKLAIKRNREDGNNEKADELQENYDLRFPEEPLPLDFGEVTDVHDS